MSKDTTSTSESNSIDLDEDDKDNSVNNVSHFIKMHNFFR